MVTDRLKAWVQFSLLVLDKRLSPAGLADDIALVVADVPVGVLQVFSFARVIVNLQLSEETETVCHTQEK